jgi:hypothetical protein
LEILLTVAYALLFIFLIRKLPFFRLQGIGSKALPAVFVLKIFAGLSMFVIYKYYYHDRSTADIFKYFDDSEVMYNALFKRPADFFQMLFGIGNDTPHFASYYNDMHFWVRKFESNIYNDSHTIIRLNAVLRFFSFGYYNVHTVFMCFLSLAGLTGVYRVLEARLMDRRKELFLAVFLIPSVLFWGSGVLKEGLLFFGLGMLLWHVYLLIVRRKMILSILFIAGSFVLLLYTKFYIIMILLPLLLAFIWCELTGGRRILLKYTITILVFTAAAVNLHYVLPQYDLIAILVQKQNDFLNLAHEVKSGSMVNMEPLVPDFFCLMKNIPIALYNSLFRPWFFEGGAPFILLAGIENLIIMIIIIFCAVFFNRHVRDISLFLLCLFFALGVLILTGLTTPVMGAIVRYKVPALPFLWVVFIMMTDKTKLINKFPLLGRFLD